MIFLRKERVDLYLRSEKKVSREHIVPFLRIFTFFYSMVRTERSLKGQSPQLKLAI